MGQLKPLQEDLRKILFIGDSKKSSRFSPRGLPHRLQVYRNTMHANAYETLDLDFPMTRKQFSKEAWFDLEKSFFIENPPNFWELNNCVLSFPKFLKSKKVKPWIAELAEYESTDLQTFLHPAVVRKKMGRTNPTAVTRVFQYQIFDWVSDKCPAKRPPLPKPEVLVFYRDTHHGCHVRPADPLLILMLDHFKKGSAHLKDLEPAREKLLPNNRVPLNKVLKHLIQAGLILL